MSHLHLFGWIVRVSPSLVGWIVMIFPVDESRVRENVTSLNPNNVLEDSDQHPFATQVTIFDDYPSATPYNLLGGQFHYCHPEKHKESSCCLF